MMLAQHHFSTKKLHKKSSNEAIEMLLNEKNINYFTTVDEDIRRGLFICNIREEKHITYEVHNKKQANNIKIKNNG